MESSTYKVTGTGVSGKRFKVDTKSLAHALGINLWRGSVWELEASGKWKLIKRVYN